LAGIRLTDRSTISLSSDYGTKSYYDMFSEAIVEAFEMGLRSDF